MSDGNNPAVSGTITVTVNPPSPYAAFTGRDSVTPGLPDTSGTITIFNGSMAFIVDAHGGFRGRTIFFTINGTTYTAAAPDGENISVETPIFDSGPHSYTLSGTFGSSSANVGGVVAFIP